MVTLNSLDSLIDDIISEARSNNVSESESLSRIQIEQWIHQYRALLIKQDLDKGRYTNPSYIQELSYTSTFRGDGLGQLYIFEGDILPNTIDLHFKSGITGVFRGDGVKEIQLIPVNSVMWTQYKKYSKLEDRAYLKNNRVYIIYNLGYEPIIDTTTRSSYVRGIFEDPSLVPGFKSSDVYPIPANMISTLKQLIFEKEFKVTLTYPTDSNNNSSNDLKVGTQQK